MPIALRARPALVLAALSFALAGCGEGEADARLVQEAAAPTTQAAATQAAATPTAATNGAPQLVVYKSPTCGCCKNWVEHMREHGFAVETRDVTDLAPVKAEHGIGRELESCHTGIVDGYVIEGHVPADLVAKLLTERPEGVKGLAVPGMPMGSPGMEGLRKESYDVLAIGADGRTSVYAQR